jgi:hypothetical protein
MAVRKFVMDNSGRGVRLSRVIFREGFPDRSERQVCIGRSSMFMVNVDFPSF